MSLLRREVGAGVVRAAVRRAEHRHGPTPRPGQCLSGGHVERIEVGSLFAVHLYRDEPSSQILGGHLVLKALVGHHVAPVTGGVADGEEDRLVLVLGPLQGLVTPGVPLDRVVRMLTEGGGGLVRPEGHDPRCYGSWRGCPRARLDPWTSSSMARPLLSPAPAGELAWPSPADSSRPGPT